MNQTELAAKAGIGRNAVSYWECRDELDHRGWAVKRMAAVLFMDLKDKETSIARAGGWGDSRRMAEVIKAEEASATTKLNEWKRKNDAKQAFFRTRLRVTCGAKTRKDTACRHKSEPGKTRCKFHGGMSTGARTPEGLARIVEAQQRRWARYHAEALSGEQSG